MQESTSSPSGRNTENIGGKDLIKNRTRKAKTEYAEKGRDVTETMKMLSHEIRTPLCLAKIYLQMAERLPVQCIDQIKCFIAKANCQVDAVTTITEDFLNLSLKENSMIPPTASGFEMIDLISETIREAGFLYPRFSFDLRGSETAWVNAERHKIKQVLNNYINNAVKYSADIKKIVISCSQTTECVTVNVKDFGTGIEKGLSDKIFQRSFRVRGPKVSKIEGNGYGLFLVKQIIREYQGKVGVLSTPGEGSNFYFSLPALC